MPSAYSRRCASKPSTARREKKPMSHATAKTVLTGCLAPIDKDGLDTLIAKGKADPKVIKTLKCKTVAEGRFRHLNFIRNLPAYVVDEPPGLLGDDTAPNPSGGVAGGTWFMPRCRHSRQCRCPRHHRLQARDRAGVRAIFRRSRSGSPTCGPKCILRRNARARNWRLSSPTPGSGHPWPIRLRDRSASKSNWRESAMFRSDGIRRRHGRASPGLSRPSTPWLPAERHGCA
jgi:hypothetical protein